MKPTNPALLGLILGVTVIGGLGYFSFQFQLDHSQSTKPLKNISYLDLTVLNEALNLKFTPEQIASLSKSKNKVNKVERMVASDSDDLTFTSAQMKTFLDNLVRRGSLSRDTREDIPDDAVRISCGNQNSSVFGDYVAAKVLLTHFKSTAVNMADDQSVTSVRRNREENQKYISLFSCMENQFEDLDITCQSNHGGEVAKTRGFCPMEYVAYVIESHQSEVFLGPLYHSGVNPLLRACIHLHEVSHLCGATDEQYFGTKGIAQHTAGIARPSY